VRDADLKDRWKSLMSLRGPDWPRTGEPPTPPASEAEIQALEALLRRPLPPSYRALLEVSSCAFPGWTLPPAEVNVVPKTEPFTSVLWVNPEQAAAPLFDVQGSVARHLLGRDGAESCLLGHLLHAVVVARSDGITILLDPIEADADGEWRAWDWWREGCAGMKRSLLDFVEELMVKPSPPAPPPRTYGDPALDMLALDLESGEERAAAASAELEARVLCDDPRQQRALSMHALLASKKDVAKATVRRLMAARPDDPIVVGNALADVLRGERSADVESTLRRALRGPNRRMFASSLAWRWQWPELVVDAWRETGDVLLLNELLKARHPGTMRPAIDALLDARLDGESRAALTHTLSHTTRYHPDPPDPAALLAAARLPENDPIHLAQALLGWDAVDDALGLLGPELEEYFPPSGIGMVAYLLNAIAEMAPPAAVPVLIASLRRKPTTQVLRTLAFIDDPDTVPAIGEHLDGELRTDALIGLEQLATPAALDLLASRAAAGDIDCARALARHRDQRAFRPLVSALAGLQHRSAVTGLRDLRHVEAIPLLERIVVEDADDDIATIAAHGVVMAGLPSASTTVHALSQRRDPDVRDLAAHWLNLLRS
jgi:hypothetical protein